jgi:hypothetical protein
MTILVNWILSKVADRFDLEWEAADSTWIDIVIWCSVAVAAFVAAIWLWSRFAS